MGSLGSLVVVVVVAVVVAAVVQVVVVAAVAAERTLKGTLPKFLKLPYRARLEPLYEPL